jgi:hypothetical protein
VLYGSHLALIASINAILWWFARNSWHDIAGAVFPVLVFVPGTLIAAIAPEYAVYFWSLAFGAIVVRPLTEWWRGKADSQS